MKSGALRLILADDHYVVRMGIKAILAEHPIRFKVVSEVANGHDLLATLKTISDIDVVVTDFSMSQDGQDGLRLLQRLRDQYPHVGIVVLTMLSNAALFRSIRRLGVHSIISKGSPDQDLCQAIENAARNISQLSSETTGSISSCQSLSRSDMNKRNTLSPREAETLRLLLTGLGVSEIARTLHRSKKTISAQKHAAMLKLGLENDAQLFKYLNDQFDH